MPRPRDPDVDLRIITAVRELLTEGGYEAVTTAAVAKRARVGRPTIYRRWSSRAQMVFAAETRASVPASFPDTGSLRGDLRLAVTTLAGSMASVIRAVVGEQIGAMIIDADFARAVGRRRLDPDRDLIMVVWERALARGEVRPDIDGREVLDDLAGVFLYRIVVRHEPLSDALIESVIDRVLNGILADPGA